MGKKLEHLLIVILTIGFVTLLGHEMGFWGPSKDLGVVYLQDYDCSMKYTHAKEELNAYANVLHRIWIDNPSYVEDVLCETDEFCILSSVSDFGDIFEFWSEEDSIQYNDNICWQEQTSGIVINYLLKNQFEPDSIPLQAPQVR